MVNVYINYEKKFAFVEFRTGAPLRPHACLWQRCVSAAPQLLHYSALCIMSYLM